MIFTADNHVKIHTFVNTVWVYKWVGGIAELVYLKKGMWTLEFVSIYVIATHQQAYLWNKREEESN